MNSIQIFKKAVPFILVAVSTTIAHAQSPRPVPANYAAGTQVNHVRTWDATAPEKNPDVLITRPLRDVKTTTQYMDGLGRPLQTVIRQGSIETATNTVADLVSPVEYDSYGQETIKYLPFAANTAGGNASVADGKFKLNPFQQQAAFMNAQYGSQGETFFYSKTDIEASPLGRAEKQMAAGNSWAGAGRGVEQKYWLNTDADLVKIWTVSNGSATAFGSCTATGTYTAGLLSKTVTVDEEQKQVIEFKDKEGKLILKKVQLTAVADNGSGTGYTGWLSTYYIYDDMNKLACVVQPEGVKALVQNGWVLSATIAEEQCFRYGYDDRGRMTMKKVPGAGVVWMVYDMRDRLVMTQEAKMRSQQRWMYTSYDLLNRPVATGFYADAVNFNNLAYHLAQAAISSAYPVSTPGAMTELTRTFYDDYSWLSNPAWGCHLLPTYHPSYDMFLYPVSANVWPYAQANLQAANTKGLVTGTIVKRLDDNTSLFSVPIYNDRGQVIQMSKESSVNTNETTTTQYSWSGQVLATVDFKAFAGVNFDKIYIITKFQYDDLGRLLKTDKTVSHQLINNGNPPPAKTIAEMQYDKLGQVKVKKLAPAYNNGAGLESLTYDYNIRGWMLGMNRDYVRDVAPPSGGGGAYFGFDLGYDKTNNNLVGGQTYTAARYNGNITGMVWKSRGDGEKRKYDFTYDAANRLLSASFKQYTGGSFNLQAGVDFSVKMGNGTDPATAYDDNGNILQMQQWGLKITGSSQVDNLKYTYYAGANRLKSVTDFNNDAQTLLGDFRTAATHPQAATKAALTSASTTSQFEAITDYTYDVNGNMQLDNNKAITAIEYNHLNLPALITVAGKGTISYVYDAAGIKLKKIVTDNTVSPAKITTTEYVGGLVYENGVLQFINMEEGRIRYKPGTGNTAPSLQYDYMLKDHLGNVRMVLTEEQQQDKYPVASMEDIKLATEQQYYTINTGNIVAASTITGLPAYINDNGIGNNPEDAAFSAASSQKLYKLNSNTNKTGLGITLKVMAGDRIDIFGKSYYFQNNTGGAGVNSAIPVMELLGGLLGTPGNAAAGGHTTATELNSVPGVTSPLSGTYLSDPGRDNSSYQQRPRAFINYVFLDEQFKFVAGGFSAVNNTPGLKDHFSELQNKVAQKNGYVYIYVSNESPVNVFFDNLQVVHTRGPILEETHYYPFGLTMNGISSKCLAFGKPENKEKTFQGQRFDDELDLNWVQFKWRNHDPQIGRFVEIDPLSEKYVYNSTYAFSENKVIRHVELEGLESWDPMSTLKNSAGFEYTSTKSFINNMISEAKKPDPYIRAIGVLGPLAGGALVGIFTGGLGEGSFIKSSLKTGIRNEIAGGGVSTIRPTTLVTKDELNKVAIESGIALNKSGQYPASVVAGADLEGNISVAKAGLNITAEVPTQLKEVVNSLGGLGAKANNNTVGACSEYNMARPILLQNPKLKPWEIPMSDAIRPRTGEVIPPCINCELMFKPPIKQN